MERKPLSHKCQGYSLKDCFGYPFGIFENTPLHTTSFRDYKLNNIK